MLSDIKYVRIFWDFYPKFIFHQKKNFQINKKRSRTKHQYSIRCRIRRKLLQYMVILLFTLTQYLALQCIHIYTIYYLHAYTTTFIYYLIFFWFKSLLCKNSHSSNQSNLCQVSLQQYIALLTLIFFNHKTQIYNLT